MEHLHPGLSFPLPNPTHPHHPPPPTIISTSSRDQSRGSSSRSKIACDRCKEKKRKCEGNSSGNGCNRCRLLNAACITSERPASGLRQRVETLEKRLATVPPESLSDIPGSSLIPPLRPPLRSHTARSSSSNSASWRLQARPSRSYGHETQREDVREENGDEPEEMVAMAHYPVGLSCTLDGMKADLVHSSGGSSPTRSDRDESEIEEREIGQESRKRKRLGHGDKEYRGLRERRNRLEDDEELREVESLVYQTLSDKEISELFEHFFSTLNPYCALLDPALHTRDYCLSTSPILYLSILTAASLVYKPNRSYPLLDLLNLLFGDHFALGKISIGLCQALSISSVWKEPEDQKVFLRVGYAIRSAFELGLDATPVRPLPVDERKAREQLNKERTFRQLTLFDRTLYDLHGRSQRMVGPETITHLFKWLTDHPTVFCYSDSMLASSVPHGEAVTQIIYGVQFPVDGATSGFIAANIQSDLKAWQARWLGDNPPVPLHPISKLIIGFYSRTCEFEIVEWMTRVPAFKGKPELLGDMLARACTVLRYVITDIGPAGVLRFAPDILTFKIARAAFLVTKRLSSMTTTIAEQVTRLILDVSAEYTKIANTNRMTRYSARFFTTLADVVASRGTVSQPDLRTAHHAAQVEDLPAEPIIDQVCDSEQGGCEYWDGLLQDHADWFPDNLLPNIDDFGWAEGIFTENNAGFAG